MENKFTLATMIIGESGSGKSTSLRNLNPAETFIIATISKPLPFKGGNKRFTLYSKENPNGNYYCSDKPDAIIRCINYVNAKRPEIKVLVIDDFQFIMGNAFLERCEEKGFTKFTQIQKDAWKVITLLGEVRKDLISFVLCHPETTPEGKIKAKTLGKMLDSHSTLEGLFSMVLQTQIIDDRYTFLTNSNGLSICKTPMGMFADKNIDNDLVLVRDAIKEYFEIEDIAPVEPPKKQSNPQIDMLNWLLESTYTSEEYLEKTGAMFKKYKIERLDDLPEEVVTKWIAKLQGNVDLRNE